MTPYRGRIAPSPTGYLHAGHLATFSLAAHRAEQHGGTLAYRLEDIDKERCRKEFAYGILQQLQQWNMQWQEGPDKGGPYAPYTQSERLPQYREALHALHALGLIYPCPHSRKDIQAHSSQQSPSTQETLFPNSLRSPIDPSAELQTNCNYRFQVPHHTTLLWHDQKQGPTQFTSGEDFGDFLVWRKDGTPSYELAVVVDDIAMAITEVVRGADLLVSTARQLLLYQAFQAPPPQFYHCDLVLDAQGEKLSKRPKTPVTSSG